MSNPKQPREQSDPRTRGRWTTTAHAEPAVSLRAEARFLDLMAERLSDATEAANTSPYLVADFAHRARAFFAEHQGDEPVAAPPAREQQQPADYTINSRSELQEALGMARRYALAAGKAQTIDYPGDETWLRATINPGDGQPHGAVPIDPPYQRSFDELVAQVDPERLVAAGAVLQQTVGSDHPFESVKLAAGVFRAEDVDQARCVLSDMVFKHLGGQAGVVQDIPAVTRQATPGWTELLEATLKTDG